MSESVSLQYSHVVEPWLKAFTPWSVEFKPMKLQGVIGSLNSISDLRRGDLKGIEDHLIALDEGDRYLRFGYHAQDEHIKKYVESLNVDADRLLGLFSADHRLVAFAHLSLSRPKEFAPCAEFGVSVDTAIRGQGAGSRLFEHACLLARNSGVRMLFIHALSENTAMINIAKKHGATLERQGSETECHVKLPLGDLNSLMIEWSSQCLSQSNLNLQQQSQQFWSFLEQLQSHRQQL